MNMKEKSDESPSQRSGGWRQYYNAPLQVFNQVRDYIYPSISEYWNSGFGINSAGSAYLQSPKKSKDNLTHKKMENSHAYNIGPDCSVYNVNVLDLASGSCQPVSVSQNKGTYINLSVPPPSTGDHLYSPKCHPLGRHPPPPPPSTGGKLQPPQFYPPPTWGWSNNNRFGYQQKIQHQDCKQPLEPPGQVRPPYMQQAWAPWTHQPSDYIMTARSKSSYVMEPGLMMANDRMDSAMMNMMANDMATEMLVQYVCQETDPTQLRNFADSEVKSNLNPNAKEFIPKHLVAHYENNQNSEYLNKAMLETAIKSSMADVESTAHSELDPSIVADVESADQLEVDPSSSMRQTDKCSNMSDSKSSENREQICFLGITEQIHTQNYREKLTTEEKHPSITEANSSSQSLEQFNQKDEFEVDDNQQMKMETQNICDKTGEGCLKEESPSKTKTNESIRQDTCNLRKFKNNLSGHCKDDLSLEESSLDDFLLADLEGPLSSESDDESTISQVSKSFSRNLSESSDDSLIQFQSSPNLSQSSDIPKLSEGVIPKLLRLDSAEVGSDLSESEEDQEEDWDEISEDGDHGDDLLQLLGFQPLLCVSNLTTQQPVKLNSPSHPSQPPVIQVGAGHPAAVGHPSVVQMTAVSISMTSVSTLPRPVCMSAAVSPLPGPLLTGCVPVLPVMTCRVDASIMAVPPPSQGSAASLPLPSPAANNGSKPSTNTCCSKSGFQRTSDHARAADDSNIHEPCSSDSCQIDRNLSSCDNVKMCNFAGGSLASRPGEDQPDAVLVLQPDFKMNLNNTGNVIFGSGVKPPLPPLRSEGGTKIGRFQVNVGPCSSQVVVHKVDPFSKLLHKVDLYSEKDQEAELNLAEANRKWRDLPDASRSNSVKVQFSSAPATVIWEPDSLHEQLKQARISDFPQRQADKERMERLIAPILTKKHRDAVYQRLHGDS